MFGVECGQADVIIGHLGIGSGTSRPFAEIKRLFPGSRLVLVLGNPIRLKGPRNVREIPIMGKDAGGIKGQMWGGRSR